MYHTHSAETRLKFRRQKHPFNEKFFEKIDSESKAYFLGLIATDGGIRWNDRYKRMSLGFQEQDSHILEVFKKYLNSEKPLQKTERPNRFYKGNKNKKGYFYKSKPFYNLQINSIEFVSHLLKCGLYPNKTKKIYFPDSDIIPDRLMGHYLRGVLDGDGHVGLKYRGINKYRACEINITSGSKNFTEGLHSYLTKLDIKSVIHQQKNHDVWRVSIKHEGYLKFYNLLYKNFTEELCFKRKYEKFYEIIFH